MTEPPSMVQENASSKAGSHRIEEVSVGGEGKTGKRTAIIIGCGIDGPALAMFLDRVGFIPEVYEASNKPREEEGAFLELAPMGVNVLKALAITDNDIQAVGGFPDSGIEFYNSVGKRIGELDVISPQEWKQQLIELHDSDTGPIRRIIRSTTENIGK